MDLLDLKDDEQLRNACISPQEQVISLAGNQSWITKFQNWLVRVRDVSHEEFLSKDFQLSLWDTEAVSATGMGRINISAVAEDFAIAESLWQLKQKYAQIRDPSESEMLIADAWAQIASAAIAAGANIHFWPIQSTILLSFQEVR